MTKGKRGGGKRKDKEKFARACVPNSKKKKKIKEIKKQLRQLDTFDTVDIVLFDSS